MLEAPTSAALGDPRIPRLTVAMWGSDMVAQSTDSPETGYSLALAAAINAAVVSDMAVIIEVEPIRCRDALAGEEHEPLPTKCSAHDRCEPIDVEVVNSRMIRIATERDWWTIDLPAGRFCQAAPNTHHLYIGPEAWVGVTAIIVTRTRLSALTIDGTLITSSRAHRAARCKATQVDG